MNKNLYFFLCFLSFLSTISYSADLEIGRRSLLPARTPVERIWGGRNIHPGTVEVSLLSMEQHSGAEPLHTAIVFSGVATAHRDDELPELLRSIEPETCRGEVNGVIQDHLRDSFWAPTDQEPALWACGIDLRYDEARSNRPLVKVWGFGGVRERLEAREYRQGDGLRHYVRVGMPILILLKDAEKSMKSVLKDIRSLDCVIGCTPRILYSELGGCCCGICSSRHNCSSYSVKILKKSNIYFPKSGCCGCFPIVPGAVVRESGRMRYLNGNQLRVHLGEPELSFGSKVCNSLMKLL